MVGCSSSSGPRWRHRSGRLGRGRGQARGLRRSRWQRKSSGAGSCVSGPCECPAGCRAREFWGAAAELWLNGVLTVSVGARYGPGARCVRSLSIQYIVRGGLVGCSRVWWWFSWGGLGGLERRPARARAPLPSQPPGPPQAVAARCIVWQMVVLCRLGGAVVLGDCQGEGALGAWVPGAPLRRAVTGARRAPCSPQTLIPCHSQTPSLPSYLPPSHGYTPKCR